MRLWDGGNGDIDHSVGVYTDHLTRHLSAKPDMCNINLFLLEHA